MNYRNRFIRAVAGSLLLPSFAIALAEEGNKRPVDVRPTSIRFHADLDGAAALPGNSEAASGEVTAVFDPATHVLKFYAHFVGLTGEATNARFHGPAAFDRGAGATVAAPRPEARLVEGTAWLDREEEQDLLKGRWYFNVTTTKHPDGEIRGMVHRQAQETK
jgi:hypothetical protein